MTTIGIPAAGPGGVMRLTWVRDRLAHVLEHLRHRRAIRHMDRSGLPRSRPGPRRRRRHRDRARLPARGQIADLIWEAPADLTAEHGQLFRTAIQAYHAGQAEAARQLWDQTRAVWPRACAANLAALELMQDAA